MNRKILWFVVPVLVVIFGLGAFCAWKVHETTLDRSGWDDRGGYRDFHGNYVSQWQTIGRNRYYFGEDGIKLTHWQNIDGNRYYFGEDGILQTHWQDIDGSRYYFGQDGAMVKHWQKIDGNQYYFCDDGTMATFWQDIDGARYYFADDGIMVTQEQILNGASFIFRTDGTLITGWENGRYHDPEAGLLRGWQEIDGKRYCFDENGVIRTGWIEENGKRYYLLSDGSAAVGPVEIDGKVWHFSPTGVQIYLVNNQNLLSEDYEVELTLVDGARVSTDMAEPLEQMLADCKEAGNYPAIVSSYRTYWDQRYLYNNLLQSQGETGKLYSAQPNGSEHQLGLAVDIVEYSYRTLNASQEHTNTFRWLSEHCWEYGFIVRYPNNTAEITGIAYEPWHYRYVGVEAALELKELGITLEEYLGAA